jgi:hypothetical protein
LTWNDLRHFHKQPQVIAAWQRVFGLLLRQLTPGRRRLLLGLGAIIVAIKLPLNMAARSGVWSALGLNSTGLILLSVVLFGFVFLCYTAARQFSQLPRFVRRHPQICLHAVFWIVVAGAWTIPINDPTARSILVGSVLVVPFLLWRLGYTMLTAQRDKMKQTSFLDHLLYIYPVWGGSNTPIGKGWDYLTANEAKNENELAKSQLSGLKLFLLAGLWTLARDFLEGVVLGDENIFRNFLGGFSFDVPRVQVLFAQPDRYPIWLFWAAIYVDLLRNVLSMAMHGHIIVGWLRLFGFDVFRNTYKPLLAETVVDFWNRYYYYFKELLVNFFFYPTFARHFKGHPRLRIFAAVFAAAFAGNIYYHLLAEKTLASADFSGMWMALQSRVFYCLLLALGISISMLRQQRAGKPPPRGLLRRGGAIFGVWTFFSIIHIWAQPDAASFLVRVRFFLGLVGLG